MCVPDTNTCSQAIPVAKSCRKCDTPISLNYTTSWRLNDTLALFFNALQVCSCAFLTCKISPFDHLQSSLLLGGELFEYILAHRYLKEKDASRLFAQLISGVHYMHQKHIIHRDLKLVCVYTSSSSAIEKPSSLIHLFYLGKLATRSE